MFSHKFLYHYLLKKISTFVLMLRFIQKSRLNKQNVMSYSLSSLTFISFCFQCCLNRLSLSSFFLFWYSKIIFSLISTLFLSSVVFLFMLFYISKYFLSCTSLSNSIVLVWFDGTYLSCISVVYMMIIQSVFSSAFLCGI